MLISPEYPLNEVVLVRWMCTPHSRSSAWWLMCSLRGHYNWRRMNKEHFFSLRSAAIMVDHVLLAKYTWSVHRLVGRHLHAPMCIKLLDKKASPLGRCALWLESGQKRSWDEPKWEHQSRQSLDKHKIQRALGPVISVPNSTGYWVGVIKIHNTLYQIFGQIRM